MDFQSLSIDTRGRVAFVTLLHPPINLLDAALTRELGRLAKILAADEAVRVIVFRSADPEFFIAHSDVNELRSLPSAGGERPAKPGPFHQIVDRFRTMPKVTIGQVEGRARGGGCEFLMALDMRFAAIESALFGQPEVSVGLIPGGGGTQRLPRLVGRARTLEMILGAQDIDALTAERYGLINRALPAAQLAQHVETLALRIASFPAHALTLAKAAVNGAEQSLHEGLIDEEMHFRAALREPETKRRLLRYLAIGAQTRDMEMQAVEMSFGLLNQDTDDGAGESC